MSNNELALRAAAVSLIESFLTKYYEDIISYSKEEMKPDNTDLVERSNFITYHLLPALRSLINTQNDELILKSSFKILRQYLVIIRDLTQDSSLPEIIKELKIPVEYLDMASVINDKDENSDFFENILNIKLQKRYRAIRLLCTNIEEKKIFDLKTLTKIVLPIADMFIIRMTQAQNASRGVIAYTKQNFEQINTE